MKSRISFSLFPFVSIMLSMTGVLTFLTIIIITLGPAMKTKSKDPHNIIYEKKDTMAKTWLVEFKEKNISILEWNEQINKKRNFHCDWYGIDESGKAGCKSGYAFLKEIVMVNSTRGNSIHKFDQFLFLIHPSGVDNYLLYYSSIDQNVGGVFSGNVKKGLVLLGENEEYKK